MRTVRRIHARAVGALVLSLAIPLIPGARGAAADPAPSSVIACPRQISQWALVPEFRAESGELIKSGQVRGGAGQPLKAICYYKSGATQPPGALSPGSLNVVYFEWVGSGQPAGWTGCGLQSESLKFYSSARQAVTSVSPRDKRDLEVFREAGLRVFKEQIEPRAALCSAPPPADQVIQEAPCAKKAGAYTLSETAGSAGRIRSPAEGYHEATCAYVHSADVQNSRTAVMDVRWRSRPTPTAGYVGACGRMKDSTETRSQRKQDAPAGPGTTYAVERGRLLGSAREISVMYEGPAPAAPLRNAAADLLAGMSGRAMVCPARTAFVPSSPPRPRREAVGQIVGYEGDVVLAWPDGYREQGHTGTVIRVNDVLRVGPQGRARVQWTIKSPGEESVYISSLSASTELDIRKLVEAGDARSRTRVVVDVLSGWIRTHKLAVSAAMSLGPGALDSIDGFLYVGVNGLVLAGPPTSELAVGYERSTGSGSVLAREGSVPLRSRSRELLTLQPGEMATAAGGGVSQVGPLDPGLWQRLAAVTEVRATDRDRPGAAPGTTREPEGGLVAPQPLAMTLDITTRLPSGPLGIGDGRQERVGQAHIVTSSVGHSTFDPIASQSARNYHAAVRVRVERARGERAIAGLTLKTGTADAQVDGDVFFGKDDARGLLLARWDGDRWQDIPIAAGAGGVATARIDLFEVTKREARYEFRLNGDLIASWYAPTVRTEWVMIWTGEGNRSEFYDWQVKKSD